MLNLDSFNVNRNHEDYSIIVTVHNSGYPDDQSLSKFPQISINWNCFQTYRVNNTDQATSSTTGSKPPLPCPGAVSKVFQVMQSLPSCDNISGMLHAMHIPFPLDRLSLSKRRHGGTNSEELLDGVGDMISRVQCAVAEMVGERKKLAVNVTIEKQIRVPREEYEARAARAKLEDKIRKFFVVIEKAHDEAARANGDLVIRRSKQMAVELWTQIRSLAPAAGVNINNTFYRRGNPETLDLNQMQMQLVLLMESLSLDYHAMMFKPTPASRESVDALDKFWKIDGVNYGVHSENCVICMEKMASGMEITCMPCKHMFHGDCIVQWLGLRHTCPVCRFDLGV